MSTSDADPSTQDEAARAGWLYYVGGMTQDQIARTMGISRQRAQRLVSRAVADGLIHVRLEHRVTACMELERTLRQRLDLTLCRVAPSLGPGSDPVRAIAPIAAAEMERVLRTPEPLVIALGTGRALRAMVEELAPISAEQHRLVSLIGNIAPDGSASFFDVIMRIADKVRAPHYPRPVPVVFDTVAEMEAFLNLRPIRHSTELARTADVCFVGVGQMGNDAPILADGFLSRAQMDELLQAGAIGEVVGTIFDSTGTYVKTALGARIGGIRLEPGRKGQVIAIAGGPSKYTAIIAALRGKIINGLITDEDTARAVLAAAQD